MNFVRGFARGTDLNDTSRPLTEAELRAAAPSVFQTEAHESRSERFQPIPTFEVVRALEKEGFFVVGARQSVTRDPGKADFTKHLLRLRKLDQLDKLLVNGAAFEVLLKNANDGTSAYDLLAGFWRFICGNGLMVGDKLADVKVRHSGDVAHKVVDGTYSVLDQSQRLLEAPERFGSVELSRDEQQAFANAAHVLRFGEPDAENPSPYEPKQLLKVRRPEDTKSDLWTVFNRVQENAIKGGLQGIRVNEDTGQTRRTTTRQIKGIDQDVKLNRALWFLTEQMAQLKGAGDSTQIAA
jgi:hypothetical protein